MADPKLYWWIVAYMGLPEVFVVTNAPEASPPLSCFVMIKLMRQTGLPK